MKSNGVVSPIITLTENSQRKVGFALPSLQKMFINVCPLTAPTVEMTTPKADLN